MSAVATVLPNTRLLNSFSRLLQEDKTMKTWMKEWQRQKKGDGVVKGCKNTIKILPSYDAEKQNHFHHVGCRDKTSCTVHHM